MVGLYYYNTGVLCGTIITVVLRVAFRRNHPETATRKQYESSGCELLWDFHG